MHQQATSTTVYKSVPHVVKDFVTALARACPSELMAEVFDDLVQGVAAQEPSVVAVAGVLPLYEVDTTGQVKDPLALLREKGHPAETLHSFWNGQRKVVASAVCAAGALVLKPETLTINRW